MSTPTPDASQPVLEILSPGLGASLQGAGLNVWRRFGVPPGGAMDPHAAAFANRLLDNDADAPVLELMLQGAVLKVRQESWITLTGADADANMPMWRTVHVGPGDEVRFPRNRRGVWIYVGIESGFDVGEPALPFALGGLLGKPLVPGDTLKFRTHPAYHMPQRVAGRAVAMSEREDFEAMPLLRVWPGPQWKDFKAADQRLFLDSPWEVTPQSNRVGYRLSGPGLKKRRSEIISEPVLVGSVQVPNNGQPIVTMRDGPTVGGYPKIGLVDSQSLGHLAQCRPGQSVRFELINT